MGGEDNRYHSDALTVAGSWDENRYAKDEANIEISWIRARKHKKEAARSREERGTANGGIARRSRWRQCRTSLSTT